MKNGQFRRSLRFLAAFIAAYLLCLLVTGVFIHNKSRMESALMEQIVLTRANKVSNVITKLLYKTQVLSALVIQNSGEIVDFERVAATIMDDPAIKNVILAPNGIVTNTYPLEGNEQVIGLNYFSEGEGNLEAMQARDSGQLVLGGPFHLVQGGQALVGRLPVYTKGENGTSQFWGLVSVTLRYPEALEGAELNQLKEQGYAFEIWRISPDTNQRQVIAHSEYDYNSDAPYVEKPLTILNAEWHFRISPIRNWYQFPETWIFLVIGFLVSLLFGSLILHNFDLAEMEKTLENLTYTDPLTGARNRRGIFHTLEELTTRPDASFVLSYMDLDGFKVLNDTYGHAAGDKMLEQFAATFFRHMGPHDVFGRIGGDEFILICTGAAGEERLRRLLETVRKDLASRQGADGVSFSAGWAVYPRNGDTADELLAHADAAMYRYKTADHS